MPQDEDSEENTDELEEPFRVPKLKDAFTQMKEDAGGTLGEAKDILKEMRRGVGVVPRKPFRSIVRRRFLGNQ